VVELWKLVGRVEDRIFEECIRGLYAHIGA
jgi:hypothetical protein